MECMYVCIEDLKVKTKASDGIRLLSIQFTTTITLVMKPLQKIWNEII
jgi:hypothetical protein